MKDFIEKVEKESKKNVYFCVRCDDNNAPKEVKPDTFFHLWEFEDLSKFISLCENHNLKYDLVIQEFNNESYSITNEIGIVNNNYLNNR